MAIKKTELYSSLWASADELRGGMDASEYKNYVLTLLFMKYVTDKYKKEQDNPFVQIKIPDGSSFDDMVDLVGKKDIGDKINTIIGALAEANNLKGVINTADFADETKLGTGKQMVDTLSKLINIFDSLELGANTAEGDDLLGDAYEYLMRHFATESGKSKGQFYTPSEVSTILPKIIGINKNTKSSQTVYDPTCGSGSLLLKASAEAPHGLTIYGQEKEVTTTGLCKMNMIIHNNPTASSGIAPGGNSTLSNPYWIDEKEKNTLKRFDFVVANPPFSLKAWMNGVDTVDRYGRFNGYVNPPEKNGDYAFLLHIINSMNASSGKGAVILPHGVLFRGNAEATIREKLIKQGYIKGIIGLPANLFYGTGIPACIIVLDKENASSRTGIFMIDASKGFKKDGNKNRLRAQDVHKIVDTFNNQTPIDKYSCMVNLSEIESHEYNLNIPRYIDSSEQEDIQDLHAHLNGGIPDSDIENLGEYWSVFSSLKSELFKASKTAGYSDALIESNEVKSKILEHDEFKAFKDSVLTLFKNWSDTHYDDIYNFKKGLHPKEFIYEFSESLLKKFESIELISKYDIYQILMDYWAEVMQDDCYILSFGGWEEAIKLRALKPIKDKKGKFIYKEAHHFEVDDIRYVADLIPPTLLVDKYFLKEKKQIDEIQVKLDEATSKLESFIEENGEEDGHLQFVKNKQGKVTKTAINARLKECFDEVENKVLRACRKLIDSESKIKAELKSAKDELDTKLYHKYPALSIEEVKELIIQDKWFSSLKSSIVEECDRVTNSLANRVKILEERYKEPLFSIEKEVQDLGGKVKGHLKAMGISW